MLPIEISERRIEAFLGVAADFNFLAAAVLFTIFHTDTSVIKEPVDLTFHRGFIELEALHNVHLCRSRILIDVRQYHGPAQRGGGIAPQSLNEMVNDAAGFLAFCRHGSLRKIGYHTSYIQHPMIEMQENGQKSDD